MKAPIRSRGPIAEIRPSESSEAASARTPVDEERLEEILFAFILHEERGGVPELKSSIKLFDPIFAASKHTTLVSCYERIKAKALSLIAYEESHGRGTLLKPGHPFNRLLMAEDLIDNISFKAMNDSTAFWRRYNAEGGGIACSPTVH